MPNGSKLEQLKKLLQRVPVRERQAIIRRAQIRGVEDNEGQKPEQFHLDILCNLSEKLDTPHELIDKTGQFSRHADCLPSLVVAKRNRRSGHDVPEGPINNFPSHQGSANGVPDAVTLEIYSLRRHNAELTAKVEGLNNKITKALEALYSLRRFIYLWVFEGQGESYDQVHRRIQGMDGTIKYLEDRTVGPAATLEVPARWKKMKN